MVMRIKKNIVLATLFFGAAIIGLGVFLLHPTFFFSKKKIGNSVVFPESNILVTVEIARNPYRWGKGLMFRESLEQNAGMLFVFPDESKRSFWMKDTLIPLDMLFISRDRKIVTIHKGATPCTTFVCPRYAATADAMYVLEVNAGFVDKYDIREGDLVEIDTQ